MLRQISVATARLQVGRQKNQALFQADMTLSYGFNGLGSNPANSMDSLGSRDYPDRTARLAIEIPLGNRVRRSRYRQALLQLQQSQLRLRQAEQQVVVDVRRDARGIHTNVERVKATREATRLARARLEAEEKKFSVGRSTSLDVLEAQEDLAIAERNETSAVIDFVKSLVALEVSKGTLLEESGIVLEEEQGTAE